MAGNTFADEVPWGLDRINQRNLPIDADPRCEGDGAGATVYVVGTGIDYSDCEFEGRASSFYDFEGGTGEDIDGYGTWLASIAGGRNYGVAKAVQLRSVRVSRFSWSLSPADWFAGIHSIIDGGVPGSVVLIPFGGGGVSASIDNLIRDLKNAGFVVVVPAGNEGGDACQFSPARSSDAITVAATDDNDSRAAFSNWGSCVDLFAPGVDIPGAMLGTQSGTDAAAAHVAGAAAILLGQGQSVSAIINDATTGVVSNGLGSPNRLLYVQPLPCEGDLDGDGQVGFTDLTRLLSLWGSCVN